tara:strand:- start:28 stop:273 length:246 start_codon:yes stop_codon:yes gene_type:complete
MAVKRKPKQTGDDGMDRYLANERLKGKRVIADVKSAGGLSNYLSQGGSTTPTRTSNSSGGNGALYTRLMGHIGGGLKRGSK